jgi:hypothetical protein
LPGKNALAYYENAKLYGRKKFYKIFTKAFSYNPTTSECDLGQIKANAISGSGINTINIFLVIDGLARIS